MKMEMEIILDRDEMNATIPYAMIYMTRSSSIWSTTRRKRKLAEAFTSSEIEMLNAMFRQAYIWTCVKGLPDGVRMSLATYNLWGRLAEFCASL